MLKAFGKFGFWIAVCGCLSVSALAQDLGDLGSSSGIFRSSNPKTAKKTKPAPKTTTPKKKTAAPKTTVAKTEKPKPAETKTSKPKTKSTVARTSPSKTQITKSAKKLPEDVIITVGRKKTGNVDELLEQAIEEGNEARDDRDYVASEKAYRRAQSLKPRDSRAVYGLGNIFSDQQRWEEAEKAYRQAITLEPSNPEAHIALSFVLSQPVAGVNLSERYTEAEKTARRAIELDGGNAVAYDQLGVSLELSGKIGIETEQAYRNAIRFDSQFALAYAHLARLLRRNGLNKESAVSYSDAIRLASDVPTMILVAEVMQSQQRFSESEQLLRRALREDPKNPTALFLLGRALTTGGKFDEAESLLKRSVEVSPNSFVAYVQLASLYARRRNYVDAEKTLMKSLKVVPVNEKKRLSQEFELIGDGFLRLGRKTDAARAYRQAMMLDNEKRDLANKLSEVQKS